MARRNGHGTLTYPDGEQWEGEWKDGKKLNGQVAIKSY